MSVEVAIVAWKELTRGARVVRRDREIEEDVAEELKLKFNTKTQTTPLESVLHRLQKVS